MSVEAVPVASDTDASPDLGAAQASDPVPSRVFTDEIVMLLKEQNALLRELLATVQPESTLSDPNWAKVRQIASRIEAGDEVRFVAVDPTSGEYATGRTSREASKALGTPWERNYVIGAGGKATRMGTWRPSGH